MFNLTNISSNYFRIFYTRFRFSRRFITNKFNSEKQSFKYKPIFQFFGFGISSYLLFSISYGFQFNIPFSTYTFFRPILFLFEPETAHEMAIKFASYHKIFRTLLGMVPIFSDTNKSKDLLGQRLWGIDFYNPIGLAAGFDKDGKAIEGCLDMGFNFVEVGSVTPEPQFGNPKPRIFRYILDRAIINRYGFNSEGHDSVLARLVDFREKTNFSNNNKPKIVGINLGKNKNSESAVEDYTVGIKKFIRHADYIVINISSPNTLGLRNLQAKNELNVLLEKLKVERDVAFSSLKISKSNAPPLIVKISPDLDDLQCQDIAQTVVKNKIDGLIISNTSVQRPLSFKKPGKFEKGGLSGSPIYDMSNNIISKMFQYTNGKIPIIGVGGIETGEDAYLKIRAGASLVQLYSSLVYFGPAVINRIRNELEYCLLRDGFSNIKNAVGADHKIQDDK